MKLLNTLSHDIYEQAENIIFNRTLPSVMTECPRKTS